MKQRFTSGSLGGMVNDIIFISNPWSLNTWILAKGEWCHVKNAESKHLQPFGELPQPCKLLPPNWHGNCIFIRSFHFVLIQPLLDCEEHGKHIQFHEHCLLPHFFRQELCSLVRISCEWNSMIVDKAFFVSTDSHFVRSITCSEDKFISEISAYDSKGKLHSFPWWKQCNIINMSPSDRLIALGNSAILRNEC